MKYLNSNVLNNEKSALGAQHNWTIGDDMMLHCGELTIKELLTNLYNDATGLLKFVEEQALPETEKEAAILLLELEKAIYEIEVDHNSMIDDIETEKLGAAFIKGLSHYSIAQIVEYSNAVIQLYLIMGNTNDAKNVLRVLQFFYALKSACEFALSLKKEPIQCIAA